MKPKRKAPPPIATGIQNAYLSRQAIFALPGVCGGPCEKSERAEGKPQRGLEPTNLPITSRLRCLLRHWGIACPN